MAKSLESQVKKTGEVVWGLLSATLLKDRDGNPSNFIGEILDISRIKVAEIKLKESQKLFQEFLNNSIMISYVKDKDLRLIFISEQAARIFKISAT